MNSTLAFGTDSRRLQKERPESLEVRPRTKIERAPSLTAPSHTRVTEA